MKIGIAGTGLIAGEVVPNMKRWGIDTVAVCGTPRSADKIHNLASENGIEGEYTDYQKMLDEADIDTVYVAVPNFLHYEFVEKALNAGKNVIVEKPMTSNYREAKALSDMARDKGLYLFEAITTVYLENYAKIREWLQRIGDVKIVSCNFSQYSSRYDAFKAGEILPVFDPSKSGGALMDLNLYNLHYILGLFGEPDSVEYAANIEKGIDTSGVVTLDYGHFKATAIAAKDCGAPHSCVIQGTKGYIIQYTQASICGEVILHLNDGSEERFNVETATRFDDEFANFIRIIDEGNMDECLERLDHSLAVCKAQTMARESAGIVFPADKR